MVARLAQRRKRQTNVRRAFAGEVRAVDVESMQESEHESEDSEEERTGRRALQIMALTGAFPAGICNIEVQSSEESSESEDSR